MSGDSSDKSEVSNLLALCEEICRYLAIQRGMIFNGYAKDLAKQIELAKKEIEENTNG